MTAIDSQSVTHSDPQLDEGGEYRALHTGALLGLLVAIVSLVFPITITGFSDMRFAAVLGFVPAMGLLVSLWSLSKIRANADLYTGGSAALAGVAIAAASLVGGSAYGSYVYLTEVPDGYARTSFLDMKPDEVERAGGEAIPPEVRELIGKKVFIKGFIRPDSTDRRRGITDFLLVRDNNECCFGDRSQVRYFDQMAVELDAKLATDFSRRVMRLGGELGCRLGNPSRGEPELVYELKADYVK